MINIELYNYLQEIKQYEILSHDEQKKLLIDIKKGNQDSFIKLYHSNLKLVVDIAKNYFKNNLNLTEMDIIQEGNLGLLEAIKKYDMNCLNKVKFSTYAYKAIDNYIKRSLYNYGYIIRIPVHRYKELIIYNQKYNELIIKLKRIPTIKELSEELNIEKNKIIELEKLNEIINIKSLNNIVYDYEEDEFINFIPLDINIEEEIINKISKEELKEIICKELTEKQREVIILRFGIYDDIMMGYQEIANLLDYPDRRYVYELEKKALKKLKKILLNDKKKVKK